MHSFKELQALSDASLSAILYSDTPSVQDEDQRKEDFRQQVPYFLSELKRTGVTRQLFWEEYLTNILGDIAIPNFAGRRSDTILTSLVKVCSPVSMRLIRLGKWPWWTLQAA